VRDGEEGWVRDGGGGLMGETNASVTYPHDLFSMACIYELVMHFHTIACSSVDIFCDAM
jgi:hypothetical protein